MLKLNALLTEKNVNTKPKSGREGKEYVCITDKITIHSIPYS